MKIDKKRQNSLIFYSLNSVEVEEEREAYMSIRLFQKLGEKSRTYLLNFVRLLR